ncbi:ATP-binding protein [Flammeovirga kamogawensis]|uniref:histidine kinase n=1 Tax=Flammeovirga kamogawensis TaxID=373891 RepID=A0ABX8GWE8_9BACT|nr:ATP-binding protein [Flammeovirga kamogawensis]MBB6461556.1 signal transduction histidine kinase [Flammeovirga kamogawensis]QWG07512.1 transporter substrate-binding domain-containing protein [Flammeovirga kamogawensis]TRX69325.1 transporter substrate-binding domain-containing protein [Flammeovirga kamogawensis]
MKRHIYILFLLFCIASQSLHAQDSWEKIRENKKGTVTVYYIQNKPFVYSLHTGGMAGIEYEMFAEMIHQKRKELKAIINIKWVPVSSWDNMYKKISDGGEGIFGISGITITDDRKKDIDYLPAYMPDIEIIISSANVPIFQTKENFNAAIQSLRAVTIKNSTFERNIIKLKHADLPALEYKYLDTSEDLISEIANGQDLWGFTQLSNYAYALSKGLMLHRQIFYQTENDGLAIILPKNSSWKTPLSAFFKTKEFKPYINTLIRKYLGDKVTDLIWDISNRNSEMIDTLKTQQREIGLLNIESEIRLLRLTQKELEISQQNTIRNILVVSLSLTLLLVVALFHFNNLVKRSNQQLEHQNQEIDLQSKSLKKAYKDLELLSGIGRDVTAKLTLEDIITTAYKSINKLIDTPIFGIGIFNEKANTLEFPFIYENDIEIKGQSYDLNDKMRLAVMAFDQRKEFFIQHFSNDHRNYVKEVLQPIAGQNAESIIYIPLVAKHKKPIGVFTVQSFDINAFDSYKLNLLRNLAIYIRIALQNSSTYSNLNSKSKKLQKANNHILEQKELIEEKNHDLENANNEKNHLLGIVAHDLRNPLSSSISLLSMLDTNNSALDDDEKMCISGSLNAMYRMNNMIEEILDARVTENKVEEEKEKAMKDIFSSSDVVDVIVNEFTGIAERKNITLIYNMISDGLVEVNKQHFTQIIENLISNAIKFSDQNTIISTSVEKNKDFIQIKVSDQGPGFSDDDKKNLFKKYQKLSAKPTAGEKSTGLGLSIVKKYITEMEGTIECISSKGNGSTFIVSIPNL